MTRYLITGGAGFIGSHLAGDLLEEGHSVTVIDDLSTGAMANIAHMKAHRNFDLVVESIEETRTLAELVDDADVIYHLAAAVGVKLIIESPVRTIETNVHGTEVVLRAAAKKRKPVFVASTSEVYGKSEGIPFAEDGDLVLGSSARCRWAYACSKLLDEFLALAYYRERGLPVVVGRLFNTVGPRQTGRYGMVVPTFVRQALAGAPITVYGDGTQRRCFTHVRDSVRALVGLMRLPDAYGRVFNVGNNVECSILELARWVKRATASKSEIVLVPYGDAYGAGFEDMPRRVPDLTRIVDALGWQALLGVDRIIADVVRWQREGV